MTGVTGPASVHGTNQTDDFEEIVDDDAGEAAPAQVWRGPSAGRWVLFAVLAIAVVALDQLAKAWVMANVQPGVGSVEILGEWLRIVYGQNSGILFGMLPQSAGAFAIVSLVVVGLIVVYHAKVGRGRLTSIALALLLGGAIGNLLDRLRFGAVVDWIDMGIGGARFWTYNIGDAAITTAILLIVATAVFPFLAEWGSDG